MGSLFSASRVLRLLDLDRLDLELPEWGPAVLLSAVFSLVLSAREL